MLNAFIKKYRFSILGLFLGMISGFAYYYFFGCVSGTCKITSSPINSTLYGGIMGLLLLSNFESKTNKS